MFFLGSVSLVYIILNLALKFFNFFKIVIIRLLDIITYNNNVTVQIGLSIFFVLDMTKYTHTNKYTYSKYLANFLSKVFKIIHEQKTYFSLFPSLVPLIFSQIQFFLSIDDPSLNSSFLLRFVEGIMRTSHSSNQHKDFNKSNIMNVLRLYSPRLKNICNIL